MGETHICTHHGDTQHIRDQDIIKVARGKVIYKRTIRFAADFSALAMEARRQWKALQVLAENKQIHLRLNDKRTP